MRKIVAYKVIGKYERFYCCVHPCGYNECFFKDEYKPNKKNEILISIVDTSNCNKVTPIEHINRKFNKGLFV